MSGRECAGRGEGERAEEGVEDEDEDEEEGHDGRGDGSDETDEVCRERGVAKAMSEAMSMRSDWGLRPIGRLGDWKGTARAGVRG